MTQTDIPNQKLITLTSSVINWDVSPRIIVPKLIMYFGGGTLQDSSRLHNFFIGSYPKRQEANAT